MVVIKPAVVGVVVAWFPAYVVGTCCTEAGYLLHRGGLSVLLFIVEMD